MLRSSLHTDLKENPNLKAHLSNYKAQFDTLNFYTIHTNGQLSPLELMKNCTKTMFTFIFILVCQTEIIYYTSKRSTPSRICGRFFTRKNQKVSKNWRKELKSKPKTFYASAL
jgi:hypothetical protein